MKKHRSAIGLAAAITLASPVVLFAQQGEAQERVAAIKQSLERGQALLRQYEWIETTTVALKGEEKSRTQRRCYYGADGKIQKVDVSSSSSGRQPRGLRGKIAENSSPP